MQPARIAPRHPLPRGAHHRPQVSAYVQYRRRAALAQGAEAATHGDYDQECEYDYETHVWRERVGIEPTWDLIRAPHPV
jgi:hypothetical protein